MYSAIDGNHLVQLMPHLVRPLTVVAVSSTALLATGTVVVAVLIALAILPLFFAIPLAAALFLGALAGGIISICLGRWKPAQSHIPLPEKQGNSLSKLQISSSQVPLDFSPPQFPLDSLSNQVSPDSSPRQVSLGDGVDLVPETNERPGADELIREQTQEEISSASQIIQELLRGVEVLSERVKDFQTGDQYSDIINGPWIGQMARPCNGEIKDFLEKLCEQFTNLKGQSVGHLQQLLSHFREIVDGADPFWRLIAADPPRRSERDSGLTKRVPLIDFMEIVASGKADWDLAWKWFLLEEGGLANTERHNELIKHFDTWNSFDPIFFQFTRRNFPLREELTLAMANIAANCTEIIQGRGVLFANFSNMCRKNPFIQSEFKSMVHAIEDGTRLLRALGMPLDRSEIVLWYNFLLEKCVRAINGRLSVCGYGSSIDFEKVQISLPVAGVAKFPVLEMVPGAADSEIKNIPLNTIVAMRDRILKIVVDNWWLFEGLFKDWINARLQRRFGFTIAGMGGVSLVFQMHISAVERCVLRIFDDELEQMSFYNAMLGHSYEAKTRKNPNLSGRAIAYAAVGERMEEGGGDPSPTFSARVLPDPNGKLRILAMTSAGDRTLRQVVQGSVNFQPTEELLQSCVRAQLLNSIAGQLDGHGGNLMVDAQGTVRAIDSDLTFPPWDMHWEGKRMERNLKAAFRVGKGGEISSEKWESEKEELMKSMVMKLPPLTQKMKQMLEHMVSNESRAWMRQLLKENHFTKSEIQAAMNRLTVIKRQLPAVQIVEESEYLSLFTGENSPFTRENCILRRVLDGTAI
ncbi:MAG: hypothetical protein LBT98_03765 [Puniceicoccales bacterium]|nr:hypothetical protein [Puniceicoccales bacterium]